MSRYRYLGGISESPLDLEITLVDCIRKILCGYPLLSACMKVMEELLQCPVICFHGEISRKYF